MTAALEGVRIVEFANYVAGPYAGMMLADLGAEVIKIEAPGGGDPFRDWGDGKFSPTFEALNRNKKSVVLDLKSETGREQAERIIATSDVLIENFRHGVLDSLGLGYEAVAADHPALIYCSITGFGASGPYRDRPGYDTVGQGMGGLLSLMTGLDEPKPMGYSFSDHFAGIAACQGILAALLARERTGRGQKVDTSLLQATVSLTGENAARYFYDGRVPDREERTHLAQVYAFVDCDKRPFVIHLSSPTKFWDGLLAAIGHPEWAEESRFATRRDRMKNYDALHAALSDIFATDNREAWLRRLLDQDVPAGPLNTLAEVFDDPQVTHLGMKIEIDHPDEGPISLVAGGYQMSDTPLTIRSAAPRLGQHTDAVLEKLKSRNGQT
ncbi:MAG: CoA transferase [Rhodospirillaceae bacterium]|jgi:crotonobetainyl-CoA:carnitine CoA-transferase CaiB-like acyl-CoA transferase|nr:CoA transferase [Rhodospirillaceae bacterium]MBT5459953.1 CoA transferase [Rhodospirillaceae bacterium]